MPGVRTDRSTSPVSCAEKEVAVLSGTKSTPTVAIIVNCIVVIDKHGNRHAFRFGEYDTSKGRFGYVAKSFHAFTAQVHEWALTQPFDKGEVLTIATSAEIDPGAARLGKVLTWGEYRVER